ESIDRPSHAERGQPTEIPGLPAAPHIRVFEAVSDEAAAAATEGESRPFTTGRALVDARAVAAWAKISHRPPRSFAPLPLGYSEAAGLFELRRLISEYLQAARAVRCEPEQVVVTAGSQQAVDIAIRILVAGGDEVWTEDPCYSMTYAALAAAGARLRHIPVD